MAGSTAVCVAGGGERCRRAEWVGRCSLLLPGICCGWLLRQGAACTTADCWLLCLTADCWLLLLWLTAVASCFCYVGLLCLTAVLALAGCWLRLAAGCLPAADSCAWLQWLLMTAVTNCWVWLLSG